MHLVHRKKSENKKGNRGESKKYMKRNQNSNKNEFWFYENEFKYINKKEMEWNSFHYSIVATSKYTLNLYGGLLLSLVQTRLKGPLDQQKLGPKSFGPMGPLYFMFLTEWKPSSIGSHCGVQILDSQPSRWA